MLSVSCVDDLSRSTVLRRGLCSRVQQRSRCSKLLSGVVLLRCAKVLKFEVYSLLKMVCLVDCSVVVVYVNSYVVNLSSGFIF